MSGSFGVRSSLLKPRDMVLGKLLIPSYDEELDEMFEIGKKKSRIIE